MPPWLRVSIWGFIGAGSLLMTVGLLLGLRRPMALVQRRRLLRLVFLGLFLLVESFLWMGDWMSPGWTLGLSLGWLGILLLLSFLERRDWRLVRDSRGVESR